MSNSFGWPFRLNIVDSTLRESSTGRRSSCKRCVNKLYCVGELCAEQDDAEAVELVAVAVWNNSSKGLCWAVVVGAGGLRMLELKSVCIARSECRIKMSEEAACVEVCGLCEYSEVEYECQALR